MGLSFFNNQPLTIGSIVDPTDTGVGDGTTTTYPLTNKTALKMGVTVQADAIQYYQFNGGFTKDTGANTVTLASPAPNGSNIVFPGLSQVVAQAFDQAVVTGVTNPREVEVEVWIGDVTEIHLFSYENTPANPGIRIGLVNLVPAGGAQVSWCQLTSADPTTGAAMTYAVTGADMYTPNLTAFSTLASGCSAGASSIILVSASQFIVGDYIMVNIGNSTQEVLQILGKSGNTLTVSGGNFAHSAGESVFTCARKFWLKVTIPLNFTGNVAANYYNIALVRQGKTRARP